MADKFISYSAPMVRALMEDRKTNTRREVKPQPDWDHEVRRTVINGLVWPIGSLGQQCGAPIDTPRIDVGDRLWVKEAWRTFVSLDDLKPTEVWSKDQDRGAGVSYEAGGGMSISKGGQDYHYSDERDDLRAFGKLRSPRFMPKWASRLTLTVTGVKVERLQDISEEDALAEGVPDDWNYSGSGDKTYCHHCGGFGVHAALGANYGVTEVDCAECGTAKLRYRNLWNHIYGPGSWSANPWVVAYAFTVQRGNIERIAA